MRIEKNGVIPVLELDDLNVWFADRDRRGGETQILNGISLAIAPGERVGLVGESGCGKTTTILAAMGLLPSSASVSGRVLLDGADILPGGEKTIRSHRWTDIAMVFQGAMNSLNPVKTVGWQIAEAMRVHRVRTGAAADRRVDELLDMVGIPVARRHAFPHELSGGMRQRAVIAMALACDPRVLLADEPTTALDVIVQAQILRLLTDLASELHLALVLVTHDLGVVAETCDRAAVMLGGRIIEAGTIGELYYRGQHPYTRKLFASTPSLKDAKPRDVVAESSALLEVSDLRVSFPIRRSRKASSADGSGAARAHRLVAVDGISFEVARGEFVALVGQSGCGKTTTAQSVLGVTEIDSGAVTLRGETIVGLRRRALKDMRRRVQMIYQDPYESLDERFRVRQTLEEPLRIHGIGDAASRRRAAAEALERVALSADYLERYPHELSGGQRQRVSIAACLVLQPDLLLADEPVSMLDVTLRLGILELLNELRRGSSLGILMITHDLSTAAAYADRIVVMSDGRIVEAGPSYSVVHHPQAEYTKQLLAAVPDPQPADAGVGVDGGVGAGVGAGAETEAGAPRV
ncbi:MAG: ABC transporter ATP-binding protein [Actinobacteria bacterium]|nr:ABC transporter ATP-binding protein [Actinomycetota bacterium]